MSDKLVLELPSPDDKGILKFIRGVSLFNEVLTNPASKTVKEIDEAYYWLVSLVKEPADRSKAKRMVMELSVNDLNDLFKGFSTTEDPKA